MDVSRYTNTKELRFTVEFVTPCFLGGPDGNAEIRTAPFKNLLRRWWRIVKGDLSPEELWRQEAELFGVLTKKSSVELKIIGQSKECVPSDVPFSIGEHVTEYGTMELAKYIGYGAVGEKAYFPSGSSISFNLTIPDKKDIYSDFVDTLFLIHLFGTIGSRSRNGWGSIFIRHKNFEFNPPSVFNKIVYWENIYQKQFKDSNFMQADSARTVFHNGLITALDIAIMISLNKLYSVRSIVSEL